HDTAVRQVDARRVRLNGQVVAERDAAEAAGRATEIPRCCARAAGDRGVTTDARPVADVVLREPCWHRGRPIDRDVPTDDRALGARRACAARWQGVDPDGRRAVSDQAAADRRSLEHEVASRLHGDVAADDNVAQRARGTRWHGDVVTGAVVRERGNAGTADRGLGRGYGCHAKSADDQTHDRRANEYLLHGSSPYVTPRGA